MHKQTIYNLQTEIYQDYFRSSNRLHFVGRMIRDLGQLTLQIAETDNLFNAMQILSVGKLPQFLITHDTLANLLIYLETFLYNNHPQLTVSRKDIHYYYQEATFHTFRYKRHLVIIVQTPLTVHDLLQPMTVYKLTKVPLISPGTTEHYTML